MLTLENVSIFYDRIQAVKNINMQVYEGEIVTLIGGNGAGKTTTLNAIAGIKRIQSGAIRLGSLDITNVDSSEIVKMGIALSPEGRRIFPKMTVLENLEMGAYIYNDKEMFEKNIKRVYAYFPRLEERKNQYAGTLSGGEQQMLAIGRALMASPKILLLDEPSLGLAPILVQEIFEIIQKINREGVTVLLVEQNARMALRIAHRGYVIETGKIVLQGDSEALMNDERIIKAYLGGKCDS
jgi:branched-chain amino acid transport system ATP-binding protein